MLLRFLNKPLQWLGYVLLDKEILEELVCMTVAYRAVLMAQLGPGQVIIYDREKREVRIETTH